MCVVLLLLLLYYIFFGSHSMFFSHFLFWMSVCVCGKYLRAINFHDFSTGIFFCRLFFECLPQHSAMECVRSKSNQLSCYTENLWITFRLDYIENNKNNHVNSVEMGSPTYRPMYIIFIYILQMAIATMNETRKTRDEMYDYIVEEYEECIASTQTIVRAGHRKNRWLLTKMKRWNFS